MLVPKWFDKRPHLSPAQTVDELRRSLEIARELYLARTGFRTAFGLHAACIGAQVEACAKEDIPPLAAAYGPAEIDKAILDALLRAAETQFLRRHGRQYRRHRCAAVARLKDATSRRFLAGRKPLARVAIRHTVGLDDTVEGEGGVADAQENAGARYFKLKLSRRSRGRCGAAGADRQGARHARPRLQGDARRQRAICRSRRAARADRPARSRPRAAADRVKTALCRAADAARHHAGNRRSARWRARDFIIDEADDSYDAFPAARALGYRGISSKSCKGLYKSIVNATRAAKWSAGGEQVLRRPART